jgi:GDSL-like Lipase/Acylhydrolase family
VASRPWRPRLRDFGPVTCAAAAALVAAQGTAYGLHNLPEVARIVGFVSFAGWLVATFLSVLRREFAYPRKRFLRDELFLRTSWFVAGLSLVLYLLAVGLTVIPAGGDSAGPTATRPSDKNAGGGGGGAETVAITWMAEDGVSYETPENSEIRERGARVTFSIVDPDDPRCGSVEYHWSIRNLDQPHTTSYVIDPLNRCTAAAELTKNARYRVEVAGTRPNGASVTGAEEFRLKEFVIVSLGDSVASGEGNPSSGPPYWTDRMECHRSLVAGPRRAARLLQRAHRHLVVAFVHFACTGAWIDGGVNPPGFLGNHPSLLPVHPPKRERGRPELEQLDTLLGRGRHIDIVLLSVGANDIGFSKILLFCGLRPRCFNRRFHRMSLNQFVARRLRILESSFRALASRYPFNGTTPVYVTQYFDPLRNGPNDFCRIPPQLGPIAPISPSESKWAEETVLQPLNALLQRVVKDNHWNFVRGIADEFVAHGYCANRPWIVTIPLARPLKWVKGWKGFFHPNTAGQDVYGRKIFAAVEKRLRAVGTGTH